MSEQEDNEALVDASSKVSTMPEFSNIESPLIFSICKAYESARTQPAYPTNQHAMGVDPDSVGVELPQCDICGDHHEEGEMPRECTNGDGV